MRKSANTTDFALSRIYAQGWNVARTPGKSRPSNPYRAEPERSRWQTGFADAQRADGALNTVQSDLPHGFAKTSVRSGG